MTGLPVRAHPAGGGAAGAMGAGAAVGGTVEPADSDGLGFGGRSGAVVDVAVAVASLPTTGAGGNADAAGSADPFVANGAGVVAEPVVALAAPSPAAPVALAALATPAGPTDDALGVTAAPRSGAVVTSSDPDDADGPEVEDAGLPDGAPHAASTSVHVHVNVNVNVNGTRRRTLVDSLTNEAYKFKSGRGRGGTWSSSLGRNDMNGFSSRARRALACGTILLLGLAVDVAVPRGPVAQAATLTRLQTRLLSGTAEQALIALNAKAKFMAAANPGGDDAPDGLAPGVTPGPALTPGAGAGSSNVVPGRDGTCEVRQGNNVRVNDDCQNAADPDLHGRSQAQNETAIAVNPTDPENLIASANDYRRGDGGCGTYYSVNGAKNWSGGVAPASFIRGAALTGTLRTYFQASGDTDVAFDSKGTAYLQCQVFNRGFGVTQDPDVSSGILLFRSDNKGASWNFPGRVVVASNGSPTSNGFEDKPLMAVDSNARSPFADRVYVTWTEFRNDGTAPILEAHSSDAGETFSAPKVLSGIDPTLCQVQAGPVPGACDANQFSYPFVAPDGTVYVVWSNFNNAVSGDDNHNQVLITKSTDGGATFSPVAKATDYFDVPDCVTYTGRDAGRSCVPNKSTTAFNSVFRVANYPTAVVDPSDPSKVVVHVASYISRNSNETTGCVPRGLSAATFLNLYDGVLTTACHNQIIESRSTDAGAHFSGQTTDPRALPVVGRQRNIADEFFQSTAASAKAGIVVSYYDRQYGNDDVTGFNDVSVTSRRSTVRATSASSPPVTQFAGTFFGDYIRMAVSGTTAYPSWSDTRFPGVTTCPANPRQLCQLGQDEDIFTAIVDLGDDGGGGRD